MSLVLGSAAIGWSAPGWSALGWSALGWAVLLGLAFGAGVLLAASGLLAMGSARLADRVAAAVAAVSPEARAHRARRDATAAALLGLLDVPPLSSIRAIGLGIVSDRSTIERRLRRLGSARSVDAYRSRRAAAGAVGLVIGGAAAVAAVARGIPAPFAVIGVPACAVLAAAAFDAVHERRAAARARRLVDELPVVLEFLAMSLSAGEGLVDALRRVAGIGRGDLARELGAVVARIAAGGSTAAQLRALAAALEVPPITRAVEQLVGALERGAPVAEVLRAQAQDAREDERARLLEAVGRTEVAMLVPLVLVILPATVVLAIWPGILVLRLGF